MLPILLSHEELQVLEKDAVNNAVRRASQKTWGLPFLSKDLFSELSKNKRLLIVVMGDITALDNYARMRVEQELFTRVNAVVVTTSQDTIFRGTDRSFIEVQPMEAPPEPLARAAPVTSETHATPVTSGSLATVGSVSLLVFGCLSLLFGLRRT